MKISIIFGTRPEIIKMSPVIRECQKRNPDFFILHTGQHYSYELDQVFLEELGLPSLNYNIRIGSGTHAKETAKALVGIEGILKTERPDIVLVEGDTNSVLAGALAAAKLHIKVGHVEAGLRSGDINMPEEINRILTDHISYFLFSPTETAKENLLREGISEERTFVTGNTIVDAVYQNLELTRSRASALEELGLEKAAYCLATLHRQENVDEKVRFEGILKGLELCSSHLHLPIIYPIHPRAEKRIKEFNLQVPSCIRLIKPLGYLEFLQLEENARLILTDSGGIQEEACILHVPCVTLRDSTERPETIEVAANVLAGFKPDGILNAVEQIINRRKDWRNPFGDGTAGRRILDALLSRGE